MADFQWHGLTFVERANRPANSPIWDYEDEEIRVLAAENTVAGVGTAIVRAVGCPGVALDAPTRQAALAQVFAGYDTRENTGPRSRDITALDRANVAAVANQSGGPNPNATVRR